VKRILIFSSIYTILLKLFNNFTLKKNLLSFIKINQIGSIKTKEISFLLSIHFIILSVWFIKFLNESNFESLVNFNFENFYFKPYFSFKFFSFLIDQTSIEFIGFLSIVLIPFLTLILTYKVFDFFLTSKLSFLLSVITQTVYNDINLRGIFLDFKSTSILMEKSYPLIFNFPFPSMSTLIFLVLFLLLLEKREIGNNILKISTLNFFCSLYFYINAIDSAFLISIWFIFLLFDLNKLSLRSKFFQALITLTILSPGLYLGKVYKIHEYSSLNFYNLFIYNILPLIFSLVLFFTKRIDLKEVWVKFKYIYIFFAVEIFINLLVFYKVLNLDLVKINRQILQFPIHMIYYLPLIYYLKRKPFKYSYGVESKSISLNFSKASFFIFEKSKNFVFYFILILVYYFNFPKDFF